MNATQEQLFETIEGKVEELMRAEMPMANAEINPRRHVKSVNIRFLNFHNKRSLKG